MATRRQLAKPGPRTKSLDLREMPTSTSTSDPERTNPLAADTAFTKDAAAGSSSASPSSKADVEAPGELRRPTEKPWEAVTGKNMPTIRRIRIEWSVRMGLICLITIAYAVNKDVQESKFLGTW